MDEKLDIVALAAEGLSNRAISEQTGYSRNTVAKVLGGEHGKGAKKRKGRSTALDPYKDHIKTRHEQFGLSAVRLHQEAQAMGFEGSVHAVRRYMRTLKGDPKVSKRLTTRFETPPGKQAQCDWGYCGKHIAPDGKRISVYVFVMVLGYSRQMFVHFTNSMKMPELLRCHQLAFDAFGGWPEQILYDNMKQVKISRSRWNEKMVDFAGHYGFVLKTHRPYRPRTKGKVERTVDYVKDNFLLGRTFDEMDDLNRQASIWLEGTANVRVHGTTGRRPVDMLADETLTPLSAAPRYQYLDPVKRTVSWESMVHFEGSRYSVPPQYAGQNVSVRTEGGVVIVRAEDLVIAEHRQAKESGLSVVDKEHLAELWRVIDTQTKRPEGPGWQLRFRQDVQQMPLSLFDDIDDVRRVA